MVYYLLRMAYVDEHAPRSKHRYNKLGSDDYLQLRELRLVKAAVKRPKKYPNI